MNTTFKYVLALSAIMSTPLGTAQAQGFEDEDEVLTSDQLDIDGSYSRPRPDYSKSRKRLENATNDMVDKKIETVRAKNERRLQNDLKHIFTGGIVDDVGTTHAAPQSTKKSVEPSLPQDEKRFRITPQIGGSVITSEGELEDISTSLAIGLRFETVFKERFAAGIGIHYSRADITYDTSSVGIITPFGQFNRAACGFVCAPDREVLMERWSFEATGKYFVINDPVFKPYIGLGLGMVNQSFEYQDQNGLNGNGGFIGGPLQYYYGQTEYSTSSLAGSILAGTDMMFSENVGLNIDFKYQMSFSRSNNRQVLYRPGQNVDEYFLQNLGERMRSAGQASLSAGLVVAF